MKQILVPLCIFGLFAGLFFGFGDVGSTQPNLVVSEGRPLIVSDWSIAPCKYTYGYWENSVRVSTTILNLSGRDAEFDLGDGGTATILAGGNLTHSYQVSLKGQTERIHITKLAKVQGGLTVQEVLNLKIEPRQKGGDER